MNDNHKKIIKRIEDANKNLRLYYVIGPKGEKGDQGAGAGQTAYNSILYVGYQDAKDVRALTIKEKTFIPDQNNSFEVPSTINIDIKTTGIYEITLCEKNFGVTEDNGVAFYLQNITTGAVLKNLNFKLNEGTTSDMIFSGSTITEIFAPSTFQVKTNITNDLTNANITFSDICLIMKRYNT